MKAQTSLIFGTLVAIVIVGLLFWVAQSVPAKTEVANVVRPLPALPTTELNEKVFSILSDRQIHGDLPVQPLPPQPSRADPFN